ncbi:hypothetical protein SNEBB_005485 [Seison nebaliae]|nr:hypothetical protein SNEBB_005485 [Seison nebaliae]
MSTKRRIDNDYTSHNDRTTTSFIDSITSSPIYCIEFKPNMNYEDYYVKINVNQRQIECSPIHIKLKNEISLENQQIEYGSLIRLDDLLKPYSSITRTNMNDHIISINTLEYYDTFIDTLPLTKSLTSDDWKYYHKVICGEIENVSKFPVVFSITFSPDIIIPSVLAILFDCDTYENVSLIDSSIFLDEERQSIMIFMFNAPKRIGIHHLQIVLGKENEKKQIEKRFLRFINCDAKRIYWNKINASIPFSLEDKNVDSSLSMTSSNDLDQFPHNLSYENEKMNIFINLTNVIDNSLMQSSTNLTSSSINSNIIDLMKMDVKQLIPVSGNGRNYLDVLDEIYEENNSIEFDYDMMAIDDIEMKFNSSIDELNENLLLTSERIGENDLILQISFTPIPPENYSNPISYYEINLNLSKYSIIKNFKLPLLKLENYLILKENRGPFQNDTKCSIFLHHNVPMKEIDVSQFQLLLNHKSSPDRQIRLRVIDVMNHCLRFDFVPIITGTFRAKLINNEKKEINLLCDIELSDASKISIRSRQILPKHQLIERFCDEQENNDLKENIYGLIESDFSDDILIDLYESIINKLIREISPIQSNSLYSSIFLLIDTNESGEGSAEIRVEYIGGNLKSLFPRNLKENALLTSLTSTMNDIQQDVTFQPFIDLLQNRNMLKENIRSRLRKSMNKNYLISFRPSKIGFYEIHVLFNKEKVKNSPFICFVSTKRNDKLKNFEIMEDDGMILETLKEEPSLTLIKKNLNLENSSEIDEDTSTSITSTYSTSESIEKNDDDDRSKKFNSESTSDNDSTLSKSSDDIILHRHENELSVDDVDWKNDEEDDVNDDNESMYLKAYNGAGIILVINGMNLNFRDCGIVDHPICILILSRMNDDSSSIYCVKIFDGNKIEQYHRLLKSEDNLTYIIYTPKSNGIHQISLTKRTRLSNMDVDPNDIKRTFINLFVLDEVAWKSLLLAPILIKRNGEREKKLKEISSLLKQLTLLKNKELNLDEMNVNVIQQESIWFHNISTYDYKSSIPILSPIIYGPLLENGPVLIRNMSYHFSINYDEFKQFVIGTDERSSDYHEKFLFKLSVFSKSIDPNEVGAYYLYEYENSNDQSIDMPIFNGNHLNSKISKLVNQTESCSHFIFIPLVNGIYKLKLNFLKRKGGQKSLRYSLFCIEKLNLYDDQSNSFNNSDWKYSNGEIGRIFLPNRLVGSELNLRNLEDNLNEMAIERKSRKYEMNKVNMNEINQSIVYRHKGKGMKKTKERNSDIFDAVERNKLVASSNNNIDFCSSFNRSSHNRSASADNINLEISRKIYDNRFKNDLSLIKQSYNDMKNDDDSSSSINTLRKIDSDILIDNNELDMELLSMIIDEKLEKYSIDNFRGLLTTDIKVDIIGPDNKPSSIVIRNLHDLEMTHDKMVNEGIIIEYLCTSNGIYLFNLLYEIFYKKILVTDIRLLTQEVCFTCFPLITTPASSGIDLYAQQQQQQPFATLLSIESKNIHENNIRYHLMRIPIDFDSIEAIHVFSPSFYDTTKRKTIDHSLSIIPSTTNSAGTILLSFPITSIGCYSIEIQLIPNYSNDVWKKCVEYLSENNLSKLENFKEIQMNSFFLHDSISASQKELWQTVPIPFAHSSYEFMNSIRHVDESLDENEETLPYRGNFYDELENERRLRFSRDVFDDIEDTFNDIHLVFNEFFYGDNISSPTSDDSSVIYNDIIEQFQQLTNNFFFRNYSTFHLRHNILIQNSDSISNIYCGLFSLENTEIIKLSNYFGINTVGLGTKCEENYLLIFGEKPNSIESDSDFLELKLDEIYDKESGKFYSDSNGYKEKSLIIYDENDDILSHESLRELAPDQSFAVVCKVKNFGVYTFEIYNDTSLEINSPYTLFITRIVSNVEDESVNNLIEETSSTVNVLNVATIVDESNEMMLKEKSPNDENELMILPSNHLQEKRNISMKSLSSANLLSKVDEIEMDYDNLNGKNENKLCNSLTCIRKYNPSILTDVQTQTEKKIEEKEEFVLDKWNSLIDYVEITNVHDVQVGEIAHFIINISINNDEVDVEEKPLELLLDLFRHGFFEVYILDKEMNCLVHQLESTNKANYLERVKVKFRPMLVGENMINLKRKSFKQMKNIYSIPFHSYDIDLVRIAPRYPHKLYSVPSNYLNSKLSYDPDNVYFFVNTSLAGKGELNMWIEEKCQSRNGRIKRISMNIRQLNNGSCELYFPVTNDG